jgi:hypothetical protein
LFASVILNLGSQPVYTTSTILIGFRVLRWDTSRGTLKIENTVDTNGLQYIKDSAATTQHFAEQRVKNGEIEPIIEEKLTLLVLRSSRPG